MKIRKIIGNIILTLGTIIFVFVGTIQTIAQTSENGCENEIVQKVLDLLGEITYRQCYKLEPKGTSYLGETDGVSEFKNVTGPDGEKYTIKNEDSSATFFIPNRTEAEWKSFVCASGDGEAVGIDCQNDAELVATGNIFTSPAGREPAARIPVDISFAGCKVNSDCGSGEFCDGYVTAGVVGCGGDKYCSQGYDNYCTPPFPNVGACAIEKSAYCETRNPDPGNPWSFDGCFPKTEYQGKCKTQASCSSISNLLTCNAKVGCSFNLFPTAETLGTCKTIVITPDGGGGSPITCNGSLEEKCMAANKTCYWRGGTCPFNSSDCTQVQYNSNGSCNTGACYGNNHGGYNGVPSGDCW